MKKNIKRIVILTLMITMVLSMLSPLIVEAAITNPGKSDDRIEPTRYFDVTIYYNDGTNKSEKQTIEYGTVFSELPTPTRKNYAFEGWYTAETGGSQVKNGDIFNYARNVNLYAHWKLTNIEGKINYDGYDLYYYDSYFSHPSTEYNSHLATLSSYMTYFSMNLDAPTSTSDTNWYNKQSDWVKGFFESIGFKDFMANEDYHKRTQFDTIGIAVASKKIDDYTVIAVVPRSGGYFLEWSNNVWLGDGSKSDYMHEGWYNAANKLINFLDQYVTDNNITGNVKLWMAGYSRGGATTNIAAGLLDNKINKGQQIFSNGAKITRDNLYAYTFEAPQGANVLSTTVKMPNDSLYNNIFNIINPDDLVPKVAMKEWGFTRFGIDKYIYTKFYSLSKAAEERETFSVFYGMHSNLSEYKADQLQMYGLSGSKTAFIEYVPLGSLAVGVDYLVNGLEGVLYNDDKKANYDSNIVSTIITEDLSNIVGTRDNYVKTYQQHLSDALLKLMSDDVIKSKEDTEELKNGVVVNALLSILNEKYLANPPYMTDNPDFNTTMYNLIKPIFDEHPNELLTLGLNIENVFQNHEPLVTVAHMQTQDNYYVDNYNKEKNTNLKTLNLFNNADLFRADFFGFNDLVVTTDNKTIIHVEGYVLGNSDVRIAENGCAVGFYSYATEEKMKLFCLSNKNYTLTMKSFSKKPDHEVNY